MWRRMNSTNYYLPNADSDFSTYSIRWSLENWTAGHSVIMRAANAAQSVDGECLHNINSHITHSADTQITTRIIITSIMVVSVCFSIITKVVVSAHSTLEGASVCKPRIHERLVFVIFQAWLLLINWWLFNLRGDLVFNDTTYTHKNEKSPCRLRRERQSDRATEQQSNRERERKSPLSSSGPPHG